MLKLSYKEFNLSILNTKDKVALGIDTDFKNDLERKIVVKIQRAMWKVSLCSKSITMVIWQGAWADNTYWPVQDTTKIYLHCFYMDLFETPK